MIEVIEVFLFYSKQTNKLNLHSGLFSKILFQDHYRQFRIPVYCLGDIFVSK